MTDGRPAPLAFTRDAVRAVDAAAIAEYGLPGLVLMENAARGLAEHVQAAAPCGRVVIACGPGNNGGDGWAAARHLANAGRDVVVVDLGPPREGGDAATNRAIARRMGIPVLDAQADAHATIAGAAVVVDALLGTGATRAPEGVLARWIDAMNAGRAYVIAADLPSGLDADTGRAQEPTVRADETVTFVGPKTGFLAADAMPFVGRWSVVDIGVPRELCVRFGVPVSELGAIGRSSGID